MASHTDDRDLYLNRRSNVRVRFRSVVRYVINPSRKLGLGQGVTQNISLRGVQILSSDILQKKKAFDLWIPVNEKEMVPAVAHVAWMKIEDSLGDSPYWIRSGLNLEYPNAKDQELVIQAISEKAHVDRQVLHESESKIGFVF